MKSICRDLGDEYAALDAIVAGLAPDVWETVTPFDGWTIKDEISHLAYFDRAAYLAATDAGAFTADMEEMIKEFTDYDQMHRKVNAVGGAMPPAELLTWWRDMRRNLLEAFAALEPKTRLPWYGPTMSARSSATARLMETWAHGQDIVDALGVRRPATDRLKHIAHIGVSTFGWSFKNRKLAVSETPVAVILNSPSGETWTWGPADTPDTVRGPAEDFCLVVTQRRHAADTALDISGDTASRWMEIAQAFAGPPEDGPGPGERKRP